MKTEYTSPVWAMRSNPSQYFVISVNGDDISEAGENWLWQRKGFPLKNVSPSSVEEPAPYNSLSSPCRADKVGLSVTTLNWFTGSKGYDILGLADKWDLKSKLTLGIPNNSLSRQNSIFEFDKNFNIFGEIMSLKGKGGAI
ncbi:MAG: hypothetical protein AMDU3_IPLC00001G0384 [Thermoplasmatales archaeon I-plasma]|jgi:hypothetical protein|nr:MAG: hypothetical protein AMDU3_IPLC00001G0384 [Thermoplasmatales archaeon I-plasma]